MSKTQSVASQDEETVGLEELIGQTVTIICAVYIYTGKLVAIGPQAVKLEDGHIVYETGEWSRRSWADAQRLPFKHTYIAISMIESYGVKEIL